jgi:hypothetical protein
MGDGPIIPAGVVGLPPMANATAIRPSSARGGTATARRASADRFAVLNAFIDRSLPGLTRSAALTWFVLYRDTRNGTARTSAGSVGRRIGCSRRAVVTALATLRRRGLVTVVFQGGMNRGTSVYRVHPQAVDP